MSSLRDQIARKIRDAVSLTYGPNATEILTRGGTVHLTGAEADTAADAALAVIMSAHQPDLDEIPDDPAALAEMWAFICGRARWLEGIKSRAQRRAEQAEAALGRARAVHQPETAKRVQPCDTHGSQTICSRCDVIDVTVCSHPGCHGWPCKTIAALDQPEKETG